MKASFKMFLITFILTFAFASIFYAQGNEKDKGKSFYTEEEVKQMCGVPVDTLEMKKVLARQDSMYKKYLGEEKPGLFKVETIPNWQSKMSTVENQGGCGDCWVHAATGIAEGQLQILYSSRIGNDGIDMDELEVSGACGGGFPTEAENYIQTYKMRSEVGSYPNLQGVRWDIVSYSTLSGITAIKNALTNGPVAACFYVYYDFVSFFNDPDNRTAVYHYDGQSDLDGGHAVVIVSYNDDDEYWLCKNSWGSDWADGGYFRIGYGECGIETWENSKVTVNSGCYAKITPNLISSLTTALNNGFAANEWAYVLSSNNTLSASSSTTASNVKLTIKNGSTVNLNSYSIALTNGSINVEAGATINGLRAQLLAGTAIKGLCPTIQTAINSWTSGRTVKIEAGTFSENYIVANGKDGIVIRGESTYSTYLTGGLTIINSDNVHVYYLSFTGNGNLYLSNCSGFWVTCNFSDDSWYAPLSMYASSGNFYGLINNASYNNYYYGIDAEYSGDVYIVDESEIKNHNTGLNVYDGSWFYIEYVLFCDNTYDAGTDGSSYIQAGGNEWSGDPFETTFGYVGGISHNDPVCNAQKRNVTEKHNGTGTSKDSAYDDFIIVSNKYSNLLKTIHSENKNNDRIDITRYTDQFRESINDFNEFIKSNTTSAFAKTSLNIIVQILQRLNDYAGMKAYLTEIINDKNLSSLNAFAKQYMVTYYNHNQNYTSALSTADEILNAKDIDESTICNALYSKGLINEYSLSNKDEAIKDFSTIVNNYPEEPLSRFAKRELSKLGVDIDNDQRQNVTHQQENLKFTTSSYPNPFNPTTTINYTLPTDELVVLKVYDILGREVTTLVNEVKQAGSYSISFNASNLASGIYIYTISAGNFSQTKKMLLLR